jgi:hypothetical protein
MPERFFEAKNFILHVAKPIWVPEDNIFCICWKSCVCALHVFNACIHCMYSLHVITACIHYVSIVRFHCQECKLFRFRPVSNPRSHANFRKHDPACFKHCFVTARLLNAKMWQISLNKIVLQNERNSLVLQNNGKVEFQSQCHIFCFRNITYSCEIHVSMHKANPSSLQGGHSNSWIPGRECDPNW